MTVQLSHHPTRYWHRLEDGRVQCDVCPRACKIKEGQQGLCLSLIHISEPTRQLASSRMPSSA